MTRSNILNLGVAILRHDWCNRMGGCSATFAKAPSAFDQKYYQDLRSIFWKSRELKLVGVPDARSKECDSFDWCKAAIFSEWCGLLALIGKR
jgi:hypothetical protein